MIESKDLMIVLLAVFGSGGGAWLSVRAAIRIHVEYLKQGIDEAKRGAEKAYQRADHAHDRINSLRPIGG